MRGRGRDGGPCRTAPSLIEKKPLWHGHSNLFSAYKTPTNSPSGALRRVTGKYCLPHARNETLRPCRVRRVFVAKLLDHHPLLRADAKRAEDREGDQVRRTCPPLGDAERLADGIQRQRQVHRMADTAINALRDKSMLLTYLQGDRPICAQVSVRPGEEPEADHQADHTGDERAHAQRVLSERKRRRRDPDQRNEESDPGEN